MKSGIVNKRTKIVYRSLSSNYSILIEISKEVFEFNTMGQIYWELIEKFLKVYLERCLLHQTNHKMEIIFYAKLLYPGKTLEDLYQEIYTET